ncbi:hypothetical protein Hanom_Chr00s103970g01805001 [Helianthus anomalus]
MVIANGGKKAVIILIFFIYLFCIEFIYCLIYYLCNKIIAIIGRSSLTLTYYPIIGRPNIELDKEHYRTDRDS